ncbi:HAMP domain-containing sensor histidine kinase [Lysinibacillus fusiformis]|uniref:HAMP domain-containing sensor histidine kinase n=1 Tax=Lysinibacillus fusiformis TaxID=28031 RepID=UPI00215A373C|nr:HAMP domain-containing sensor histidine kinase [Lysinibacillus fusiformis]MCR8853416.1 HAMP domain-containing histidine kinase [Lysinibacillus fusiformis]
MIKSLYTRVVLTFLVAVIGGTVVSFFVATWIFKDKLNEYLQIPLLNFGQDIVLIFDTMPFQEADNLLSQMNQLKSYDVYVYDEAGGMKAYGDAPSDKLVDVTKTQVRDVLDGKVVQVKPNVSSGLVGMPLTTDKGTKAMFIEPKAVSSASFALTVILNFSTYALVIGSVVFLIAAMFLVRPIKKLTKATRHIAGGDFNVELNIKQSGELGVLARSFEEMAYDLQQLEQMRKEFVSNVSHEVQSPLTSISGYALALKQVDLTVEEKNRYLDIIMAEAQRMSKMSDSLLKLSLLESKAPPMQLVSLSLDEQIRRVIVAIQPQWMTKNIHFNLQLQSMYVMADYDQLNQVWTNLLTNSIKFSKDGDTIKISMSQEAHHVLVRITDTGIGISQEDQKRVFERFFKADRSHSQKYEGSGMGLAIVKQIVSLHKGDVRVESELGQGTTFIVTLPITAH